MEVNEPDFNYTGIYTYADYYQWTIEERVELIRGKIFPMIPGPNRMHQTLSLRIAIPINNYLNGKRCEVYYAPFDVRFPHTSNRDEDITTVLQPDICVICDPSKLDERGCIGAPDIVVEILSPSNNKTELKNKYEVYEESGVKEYWVVSQNEQTFLAYILNEEGVYNATRLMIAGDIYKTDILPGFELDLEELFED